VQKILPNGNTIRKEYQPQVTVCRNKEGEIVSDKDEILSR
jgi:hypothetical protein